MSTVTWPAYEKLQKRLAALGHIPDEDFRELMLEFQRIIVEDNRKGVLAGLDKDGNKMADVTYRSGKGKRTAARKGKSFGEQSGEYKGRGFGMQGGSHLNGNLSTKEYQQLTGPPLAPRRTESRVITNLVTDSNPISQGHWQAIGYWKQVVSVKGRSFLPAHFNGSGRLPVRDLRGVRPWGMGEARKAVRAWAKYLLKK